MKIINSRYQIKRRSSQNRFYSVYEAIDTFNNNRGVNLTLLSPAYIPKRLLDYYKINFKSYLGYDLPNIIKNYEFDVIVEADGKKADKLQYFYTSENISKNMEYFEVIKNLSLSESIDAYSKILKGVNHLHLKGMIYGGIDLENILFSKECEVYLRDRATIKMDSQISSMMSKERILYRAPELLLGVENSFETDIYALGILLENTLFSCNIQEGEEKYIRPIMEIASTMTKKDPMERMSSITEIIESMNQKLNREYNIFDFEKRNKLNFNSILLGRQTEVEEVIRDIENIKKSDRNREILGLLGERGSGKTRMLKEIEHLIEFEGIKVIGSFSGERVYGEKVFLPIIKKIGMEDVIETDNLDYEKIDKIFKEILKEETVVLILDGVEFIDDTSKKILNYIYHRKLANEKLIIIISTHEEKIFQELEEFVVKKDFKLYKLSSLNLESTCNMIKNILGTDKWPINFATRIYKDAQGNPGFTEEIIKSLYSRGILYIDKKTGKWSIDLKYEELPLPENLDRAFETYFETLEEIEKKILKIIASHKNKALFTLIHKIIEGQQKNLRSILVSLVEKKILQREFANGKEYYFFPSIFFKKIVQGKMEKLEKMNFHEQIGDILVEQLKEKDSLLFEEEVFFQYENCSKYEKALESALIYGKFLKEKSMTKEALEIFLKGAKISKKTEKFKEKIELYSIMGTLFRDKAEIDKSLECLDVALEISEKHGFLNEAVDILSIVIENLADYKDMENSDYYLLKMEDILKNIKYPEGDIKLLLSKALIYINRANFDECQDVCFKALKLYPGKYREQKARFELLLGSVNMIKGKLEESEVRINRAIETYSEFKNYEKLAYSYNNLGVLNLDYRQDLGRALNYFLKAEKLGMLWGTVGFKVIVKGNLAGIYIAYGDYEKARINLENALEYIAKSSGINYLNHYIKIIYLEVALYMNDYNVASTIMSDIEKNISLVEGQRESMEIYYKTTAIANLIYGDNQAALKASKAGICAIGGHTVLNSFDCSFANKLVEIRETIENDWNRQIKEMEYILDKYIHISSKAHRFMIFIDSIEEKIPKDHFKRLYDKYGKEFLTSKVQRDKNIGLYLKSLATDNLEMKRDILLELKEKTNQEREKDLYYNVFINLGKVYFMLDEYNLSLESYLEGIIAFKDLWIMVSEDKREYYLNLKNPNKIIFPMSQVYMKMGIKNEILEEFLRKSEENKIEEILEGGILENLIKVEYLKEHEEIDFKLEDFLTNSDYDCLGTFQGLLKFIEELFYSTSAAIILSDERYNYEVIADRNYGTEVLEETKIILENAKMTQEPVFISKIMKDEDGLKKLLPNGIRSLVCIPIIEKMAVNTNLKRRSSEEKTKLQGFVYIESKRVINNFSKEAVKKIMTLHRIISISMENYKLKVFSMTDRMTGAYNRIYFEDKLVSMIDSDDMMEQKFTLAILDLDHFKRVNDTYGHQTGDEVLKKFASVVKNTVRREDIFCRYGGEEFVLILSETGIEEAKIAAERIRRNVEEQIKLENGSSVTVSIGLAQYPEHGRWGEELIEKSDKALYTAKNSGRNRIEVWDIEKDKETKDSKVVNLIGGDMLRDSQNIVHFMEILGIFKGKGKKVEKAGRFLETLMGTIKADKAYLVKVSNNKTFQLVKSYEYTQGNVKKEESMLGVNKDILKKVIEDEKAMFLVDWDTVLKVNSETGIPEWNSIIAVPIFGATSVRGILYFTVSTKKREFGLKELSIIDRMSVLASNLI